MGRQSHRMIDIFIVGLLWKLQWEAVQKMLRYQQLLRDSFMPTAKKRLKKPVKKKAVMKKKPMKKPSRPRLHSLAALKKDLTRHTDVFCKGLLNHEYRNMCRVMVKGFCVEESPGRKGDIRTWAAAIVGAVGYVNGLFTKTSELHYTKAQLAKKMNVPLVEFNKHLKTVITGFDLIEYDPDFTLPSMIPMNPLIAMATSPTVLTEVCEEVSCCSEGSCSMEGCSEGEGAKEECTRADCCQKQAMPTT